MTEDLIKTQPIYRAAAPLLLASGSPRRRDFLVGLGLAHTVQPMAIDETPLAAEPPLAFVRRMAEDKGAAAADLFPEHWVLAADTIVVLEGEILGKPVDMEQAVTMLTRLSGREHLVYTAFSLSCKRRGLAELEHVGSQVVFQPLSPELIQAYVATGEPLDKAGAYGIQGLGGHLVRAIHGSYTNVVGLPLAELTALMLNRGVIELAPQVT